MKMMNFFGSAVCHRIAERSFILDGEILPVCARCTGIYIGIFFVVLFLIIKKRCDGSCPFSTAGLLFVAFSFVPVAIDGVGSYLGFWQSNPFLRVVTGTFAGISLPGLLLLGANFDPFGENERPIFDSVKEQLILLILALGVGLCVWLGLGSYWIISFFICSGIVGIWTCLIYLLLKAALGKRKFPFWGLAFAMGVLIILSIGMARLYI